MRAKLKENQRKRLKNIRNKKISYFKLISKFMMAAQQKKKLVEVFGIFESLLTQNPTNQDSELSLFFQTIWKTISKSKNRGL